MRHGTLGWLMVGAMALACSSKLEVETGFGGEECWALGWCDEWLEPCDGQPAGPTCTAYEADSEARLMHVEVDDTHVYWIEYGLLDDLGNYDTPGSLWRVRIEGGAPSLVASDLPGPFDFVLTDDSAVIVGNRVVRDGNRETDGLFRVPKEGGPQELASVQDDWFNLRLICAHRDTAYVGYYSMESGPLSVELHDGKDVITPSYSGQLLATACTDDGLYLTGDDTLAFLPDDATEPKVLREGESYESLSFWASERWLFREADSRYLERLPATGSGVWERIYRTPEPGRRGSWLAKMTFCGNRYFLEGRPDDMVGVAAGTVEPFTEPEVVVLGPYESQDVERSGVDTRTIGTEDAIYWFYKNRLFRTSLPTTQ